MSVITTLNSTDALEPTSRTNINTNFANLNADKQEKPNGAVTNNVVLFGASNVLVDSGKAVPAGVIVGTTDSQALTNKDLTSGTNTFPTALVTLTGSQTLSNKTLTAPIIGDFTNANHNHQNAAGGDQIAEAAFSFTNITTANATSSQHGLLPKLSGVSTDVLHGDGTYGPAAATQIVASTVFETSTRFAVNTNGGTTSFGTTGVLIKTSATASSTTNVNVLWQVTGSSSISAIDANAQFSCALIVGQTTASTGTFFAGVGVPTNGGAIDFTQAHVGWKIVGASSDQKLFATVGDGTAETASAALLTGLTTNDTLELLVVMNANSSATFYYRKNGGSQSSVVLNSHIPAAATANLQNLDFLANNNNVANTYGATVLSASWAR